MEKSKNKPIKIKDLPSAGDDCADIKSKYDKFKNVSDKPKFPPVEYERPPHHWFALILKKSIILRRKKMREIRWQVN